MPKKIINGRVYDTNTAKQLGWDSNNESGFNRWEETLYQKRNGEYFLYGEGGPNTKYALPWGNNGWQNGDRILPYTYEEARQWAEDHLSADDYLELFEAESDDYSKKNVTLSLSIAATEMARKEAAKAGKTLSEYVEDLICQDRHS